MCRVSAYFESLPKIFSSASFFRFSVRGDGSWLSFIQPNRTAKTIKSNTHRNTKYSLIQMIGKPEEKKN